MITKEADYIKTTFLVLGRKAKVDLLYESSLTDREVELLTKRFITGLSLKECAEELGLEINTVSKKQNKAVYKLYQYLINK